jgi:hypothetical protein
MYENKFYIKILNFFTRCYYLHGYTARSDSLIKLLYNFVVILLTLSSLIRICHERKIVDKPGFVWATTSNYCSRISSLLVYFVWFCPIDINCPLLQFALVIAPLVVRFYLYRPPPPRGRWHINESWELGLCLSRIWFNSSRKVLLWIESRGQVPCQYNARSSSDTSYVTRMSISSTRKNAFTRILAVFTFLL